MYDFWPTGRILKLLQRCIYAFGILLGELGYNNILQSWEGIDKPFLLCGQNVHIDIPSSQHAPSHQPCRGHSIGNF